MSLIHCPDCQKEVSRRAPVCPHCAYPIRNLTTLHQAVTAGDRVMVEDLLKAGIDVNATDANGSTGLMIAAERGSFDTVEKLIKAGADTNVQRQGGNTALMDAACNGDSRIVRALLIAGANFRLRNEAGQSALDIARKKKRNESISLLEQALAWDEVFTVFDVEEDAYEKGIVGKQDDHRTEPYQGVKTQLLANLIEQKDEHSDSETPELVSIETPAIPLDVTSADLERLDSSAQPQSLDVLVNQPVANFEQLDLLTCLECDDAIIPENKICGNCKTLIVQRYCLRCSRLWRCRFGIPENPEVCPHCGKVLRANTNIEKIAISVSLILALFVFWAERNSGQAKQQQPTSQRVQSDKAPAPQHRSNEWAPPVKKSIVKPEPEPVSRKQIETKRPIVAAHKKGKSPNSAAAATLASKITSYKTGNLSLLLTRSDGERRIPKSLKTATRLNELGNRLIRQGRYDEAVLVLRQCLLAYPSGSRTRVYPSALYNLGRSLRLAGHPKAAVAILKERLKIKTQNNAAVARELQAAKRDLNSSEVSRLRYE